MKLPDFFVARMLLRLIRGARYRLRIANAKMYCWRELSSDLHKIFAGKHVAIVAGSPQLIEKGKGREIDSHDLVVRFNLFHPADRENDLGVRTDVRFVGCTLLDKHMPYVSRLMGAGQIVTTMKNYNFMKSLNISCLYYPVETPSFSFDWMAEACQGKLKRICDNRPPRSGMVFLSMLMKYGAPARVTLYGFSMSLEGVRQVIDYAGSGVTTYDPDRYLINHCDPAVEVDLLRQLERLGKVVVGA